jgi:hypothetical protein
MSVKRLLLTLFAVVAGLSIAARASADGGFFHHDHGGDDDLQQYIVACDVNAQAVPAGSIALASCSAPPGAYTSPSGPIPVTKRGAIRIEFIGADASTSAPGAFMEYRGNAEFPRQRQ